MREIVATAQTQDEKIMAGLAHVTAIIPFMGIVAPIIIWATQKDKSPYIAFQALQALVYQLTMILAYFVGMGCYMLSFFGLFFGSFAVSTTGPPENISGLALIFTFIPFITFGLIIVGGIAFVLYGLVGAVQAVRGQPFRYVIIGSRLARYLQEDKEV